MTIPAIRTRSLLQALTSQAWIRTMLPAAAAAYLRMSQACEELHLSKGELSELHGLSEIPKDSELLLAALCRLLSRRGTHPSTLLWSSSRSEGIVVAVPGVALHFFAAIPFNGFGYLG